MNMQPSRATFADIGRLSRTSLRFGAIGDEFIGPVVHSGRGPLGLERYFLDDRFVYWLCVIVPELELDERFVLSTPGETTVSLSQRLPIFLGSKASLDACLISVGTEDCIAATHGVAPEFYQTVEALEAIASMVTTAGIMPVFIIPPPSTMFANGLFADRYIAIAATLRRLSAKDPRICLIDPTKTMIKKGAFGIEPDPRYGPGTPEKRMSKAGAMRLAQCVAEGLQRVPAYYDDIESAQAGAFCDDELVIVGSAGNIRSSAVSGFCASGYTLDAHQTGGLNMQASVNTYRQKSAQMLTFRGHYSTGWGFISMGRDIEARARDQFCPDDVIEACCRMSLVGDVTNIASVSLNLTVVWDNDFIGLQSNRYIGGPGVGVPYSGQLRTPPFTLTHKPLKMNIALHVHLLPGENLTTDCKLSIRSLALCKAEPKRRFEAADVQGNQTS